MNWKSVFGRYEPEEKQVAQNLRILRQLGWLYGIREIWHFAEVKIIVRNLHGDETSNLSTLMRFLGTIPIRTQEGREIYRDFSQVWIHFTRPRSFTEGLLSVEPRENFSWGLACALRFRTSCLKADLITDVVVVEGSRIFVYHLKESSSDPTVLTSAIQSFYYD